MSAGRKRRLRVAAWIAAMALTLALPVRAAHVLLTQPATTRSIPTSTPAFRPARPYWLELTAAQRQALAPLSDDWERLDSQTKKKWLEIAHRYPKMRPEEQQHTQQRMREWALLTPEQRTVARDTFARVRAMPPERRAEMLRKYRELPDTKRHELASEGRATRMLVVPKSHRIHAARRVQLSEGAKVKNPALAAQKASHASARAAAKHAAAAKPPAAPAPPPAAAVPATAQPAPGISTPSAPGTALVLQPAAPFPTPVTPPPAVAPGK